MVPTSWLIPFIIIVIIIVFTVIFWIIAWSLQNPATEKSIKNNNSVITHKSMGESGQMGNQFFQIACLIGAKERSDCKMVIPNSIKNLPIADLIDLSNFDVEDIKTNIIYREFSNYEKIYIPNNRRVDIRGYRQDYLYFIDAEDEVRRMLKPKREMIKRVKKVINQPYIAIHIRKGYDNIWFQKSFPFTTGLYTLPDSYYIEAVKYIKKKYDYPIYICTDDKDRCKGLCKELGAEFAPAVEGVNLKISDFLFLYLSSCLIISNSTYSWWAAYLRKRKITICPDPWWYIHGLPDKLANLNSCHLQYYDWAVFNANGALKRERIKKGEIYKNESQDNTLGFIKTVRGIFARG